MIAGFSLAGGSTCCRPCQRRRRFEWETILSPEDARDRLCVCCGEKLVPPPPSGEFDPMLADYCSACREVLVRYNGVGKAGPCSRCRTAHDLAQRRERQRDHRPARTCAERREAVK